MDRLDRHIAPTSSLPKALQTVTIEKHFSPNEVPLYLMRAGNESITRIDFIFQAGSVFQKKLFTAGCSNTLLTEGSHNLTSHEIAERLDFMGSYLYPFMDREEAGLHLFSLDKHVDQTTDLAIAILSDPAFSSKEIQIYKEKKKQNLLIDLQRVEVRARRQLLTYLFGTAHPYGIHGSVDDLLHFEQDDLFSFHHNHYTASGMQIIVTGPDPLQFKHLFLDGLSKLKSGSIMQNPDRSIQAPPEHAGEFEYIEVDQATQVALRIGRLIPTQGHEDFIDLSICNVILGGYFGSRLMQNLREDKGFTYGIGSALISYKKAGFMSIAANLSPATVELALEECWNEFRRLQNELVTAQELNRVRNYLVGELQRQMDGPFALADTLKSLLYHNQDFTFVDRFFSRVLSIDPESIRQMAVKYLNPEDFVTVAAGPRRTN